MKVNLYMDIYAGMTEQAFFATSNPCQKAIHSRRMMITVDVPDAFLYGKVDQVLPVIESCEVDKGATP
jgi:hypothetical protein